MDSPVIVVAVIAAVLVALNFFVKKPSPTNQFQSSLSSAATTPAFSIRQQQADESIAAVAAYIRAADEEAWRAEQLDRAQEYLEKRGQASATSKS
jgi:hypothetical protein